MDVKEKLTEIVTDHFSELSKELLEETINEIVILAKENQSFNDKIVLAIKDNLEELGWILEKVVEISEEIRK